MRDELLITMYRSAIRYALGRRTYITSEAVDWTKRILPELMDWEKRDIMGEINSDMVVGNLGDSCDIENWNKIIEILSG